MNEPKRAKLTADQLLAGTGLDEKIENSWFLPHSPEPAVGCPPPFSLVIRETAMQCNHAAVEINGKRIDRFPGVTLHLAGDGEDLVPLDRGLIRDADGDSYWDLTVSPGKTWKERGDRGWSRFALPFQLSNIFENDTHHGIAMFLYHSGQVSPVYFQVVAETKPFLCPDGFQARGYLAAAVDSPDPGAVQSALQRYRQEKRCQHPILPLEHWRSARTRPYLDAIGQGFGSETSLVSGLVVDDGIYATPCHTVCGDYPYPRAMKFGIWSATKTAFCTLACLRLARISGEDPRQAVISDLLPEAAGRSRWREITVGDCLNMASSIGTAAPEREPLDIFADYLLEYEQASESELGLESYRHYFDWFLAPGQHEKNTAALACPGYPWPPGSIARYRDQDLYITGVALDVMLKRLRGPDARLWDMVRDEVYRPAGIFHAVKFHTLESDPSKEVPLSDAGLLLTLDNIARLGKLILDRGRIGDRQVLDQRILDEIFDHSREKGLPTGTHTTDGEIHYHGGTWHLPYRSLSGKSYWIPTMRGYGGQLIQTLPNGTTAFRFGFDEGETEERYDALKLARLSDGIRPF
ncbi:MAG: serine hydrolase [Gammaproteobacteria bacterium]|nr:serine hydrolase [Gammaproteobacteria bacterium]